MGRSRVESGRRQRFCADDTDDADKGAETSRALVLFHEARESIAPSNKQIVVSVLLSASSAASA